MEIAIWTTVLTTIVTIIQTYLMWFFSQRVKLEDSEMDELVDKLEDDDDDVAVDSVSRTEVNLALNAVESDVADTLEVMLAQIDFALSGVTDLVKAVEGISERVSELELDNQHFEQQKILAEKLLVNVGPYVAPENTLDSTEEPPSAAPHITVTDIPAASNIKQKLPRTAVGVPERRVKVKREVKPLNVHDKDVLMSDTTDQQPDPIEEAPLKGPRKDDEPMITDLRAVPFEESAEGYENHHDLPAFGDGFEAWGAKGGRAPRQRGFRRI